MGGIDRIALEVGNIQYALDPYGCFVDFEILSQSDNATFIYFGNQCINLTLGRDQASDDRRHFGFAADNKELALRVSAAMGVNMLDG